MKSKNMEMHHLILADLLSNMLGRGNNSQPNLYSSLISMQSCLKCMLMVALKMFMYSVYSDCVRLLLRLWEYTVLTWLDETK